MKGGAGELKNAVGARKVGYTCGTPEVVRKLLLPCFRVFRELPL